MKLQLKARLVRTATLPTILIFAIMLGTAMAATAPSIVGDWEGALNTGRSSLRVVIHVTQDASGKLTATMDSPDQGATGIAIPTVTYQSPDFHFEIQRFSASYDGKLSKEGSEITGQWKQGSGSLPLNFKRANR